MLFMNILGVGEEDIHAYFKSLIDISDHIKKTHFKILTYSVGRKLDESEVEKFMQKEVFKSS